MDKIQRDYIIKGATSLFLEQGIKAVRMDDIAQSLSISKRTLYEMFADKRELLACCLEYYFEEADKYMAIRTSDAADIVEEIVISLNEFINISERDRIFTHSARKFYPEVFEPIHRKRQAKARQLLQRILTQGVKEEVFVPSINIDLTIAMFSMMVSGIAQGFGQIALPTGVTMKDSMEYIMENFFRGLSTEKGLQLMDKYKAKYTNYKR